MEMEKKENVSKVQYIKDCTKRMTLKLQHGRFVQTCSMNCFNYSLTSHDSELNATIHHASHL